MGLPQNFVYCLEQDLNGYLWIGTGEGLVRYDGIEFVTYSRKDSLASDFVHTLFVDKDGILWVGHDNGTLSYFLDGFHEVIPKERISSPVKDICQDSAGNIWATLQNTGLLKISTDKSITTFFNAEVFGDKLYYAIESVDPFNFLVGTSDGLFVLKIDSEDAVVEFTPVNDIPMTNVNAIVKRRLIEGEYWVATEDEGFYLFKYDESYAQHFVNNELCVQFNVDHENILDIFEENNGNLLLATFGKGVIKLFWDPTSQMFNKSFNFSTQNGLNHDYIKDILADRENNYWFATYGGGVSVLLNDYFIHYDLDNIGFRHNKALSVMASENDLWIGLENGVLRTDPYCFADHEFYDNPLGIPNDRITGFEYDQNGILWVSSANDGLYYRNPGDLKFVRYSYAGNGISGNRINDMAILQSKIYLATFGGLYIINTKNNKIDTLTTRKGLPHNTINFVYIDEDKKIWIGPKSSGICMIDSVNIDVHRLSQSPINVSGMTKDSYGNMWLCTVGKGVLKYMPDAEKSLEIIDVKAGLSKNYCYDIVCDKNDCLWIAHQPGLSSIDINTNQIRNFGYKDNMGDDFYRIWEDEIRNVWFASSHGVIKYFPDRDKKNMVAPLLNFTEVDISAVAYRVGKKIVLPYSKKHKFRFVFRGISFKDPEAVTYQYKLEKEGDEERVDWVDLGSINFREYEYLPDGKYTLGVRAFNADGIANVNPLSIKVEVEAPIWKTIWFYLLLIATVVVLVYIIIKYRERRLIIQKKVLQQEVAFQTVVLRKQKAEIERKSQDITASITYAKRIQKSILPQVNTLKSTFPDSFVFFVPRDIVSGDFYWFDRNEDVFTLCCADCTGHGVPGAFMSMIGSTILNDIYKLEGVNTPADILERLDDDIRVLLQTDGDHQSKDGMDISVIQINLSTGRVMMASAKRPVYLFINNELCIYNGTRRSIGDDELTSSTSFVNYEYECSKGDSIYLFSDGYPDQFGGPKSKKMMKLGVKQLLEEIQDKSMVDQGDIVKNYFFNWKGNLDQVDDVLFMGIKL